MNLSAGKNGYSTNGLRSDSRQWLIYDDESLGALIRGLEAYALHVCAGPMVRHRNIAVRGVGTLMQRVANTRIDEMRKAGGAQQVVVGHLEKIFRWLASEQAGRIHLPEPVDELDEIYAAAFRLDSRARTAGFRGPGVHREAVRGD